MHAVTRASSGGGCALRAGHQRAVNICAQPMAGCSSCLTRASRCRQAAFKASTHAGMAWEPKILGWLHADGPGATGSCCCGVVSHSCALPSHSNAAFVPSRQLAAPRTQLLPQLWGPRGGGFHWLPSKGRTFEKFAHETTNSPLLNQHPRATAAATASRARAMAPRASDIGGLQNSPTEGRLVLRGVLLRQRRAALASAALNACFILSLLQALAAPAEQQGESYLKPVGLCILLTLCGVSSAHFAATASTSWAEQTAYDRVTLQVGGATSRQTYMAPGYRQWQRTLHASTRCFPWQALQH